MFEGNAVFDICGPQKCSSPLPALTLFFFHESVVSHCRRRCGRVPLSSIFYISSFIVTFISFWRFFPYEKLFKFLCARAPHAPPPHSEERRGSDAKVSLFADEAHGWLCAASLHSTDLLVEPRGPFPSSLQPILTRFFKKKPRSYHNSHPL